MNRGALSKRVLYKDDGVIVIDKPSGIPVHIGAHAGTALEQFFDQLKFDLQHAPWLAHRLDRETSGCLVLGRTKEALKRLGKQFAEGKIDKTYWAVVVGAPAEDAGIINRSILKTGKGSRWRIILDDAGQEAITEYRVLGKGDGISWVEFSPQTGRTHQIRVHAAYALGCPLVGDPFYGVEGSYDAKHFTTMLHARAIALPAKHAPIEVVAPIPDAMRALLERCGYCD
ncbi:MAG: RNA pseudouridine synthase [Alphaproteobacteria bacterium]|nr:RNA pseudouridine synthase [Alphaproteobacteria bacterium]